MKLSFLINLILLGLRAESFPHIRRLWAWRTDRRAAWMKCPHSSWKATGFGVLPVTLHKLLARPGCGRSSLSYPQSTLRTWPSKASQCVFLLCLQLPGTPGRGTLRTRTGTCFPNSSILGAPSTRAAGLWPGAPDMQVLSVLQCVLPTERSWVPGWSPDPPAMSRGSQAARTQVHSAGMALACTGVEVYETHRPKLQPSPPTGSLCPPRLGLAWLLCAQNQSRILSPCRDLCRKSILHCKGKQSM